MFNLLKRGFAELKKKILGETETPKEPQPQIQQKEKKQPETKPKEPILKIKKPFSISRKIRLNANKIKPILEEFELMLISADVSVATAEKLINKIKNQLLEREFDKKNLDKEINTILKNILMEELSIENNFWDLCNEKPNKILFLGPNGHGKTTTIAKLAFLLNKKGFSCILACSDTFRAAAIEQLQHHANNLGTRIIKSKYGADPTSVAYDAVNSAKAHNIDFVLIDTAGRLETNFNLLQELKKMDRVIKPTLKIFVAEALAGNNLIESAKKFDQAVGIDGFILTKIDCDVKGGSALSLISEFKKPIFFLGTGQNYDDLIEFSPSFILNRIM